MGSQVENLQGNGNILVYQAHDFIPMTYSVREKNDQIVRSVTLVTFSIPQIVQYVETKPRPIEESTS